MISFDIARILEEKGIDNPIAWLHKNGFTRHTSHNILYNIKVGLNFKHLEQLCILLQCTPNQLLKYTATAKTPLDKNHPLNALKHPGSKGNISAKIKQLPPDKLDELRNYLDNMDSEKKE